MLSCKQYIVFFIRFHLPPPAPICTLRRRMIGPGDRRAYRLPSCFAFEKRDPSRAEPCERIDNAQARIQENFQRRKGFSRSGWLSASAANNTRVSASVSSVMIRHYVVILCLLSVTFLSVESFHFFSRSTSSSPRCTQTSVRI